MDATGSVDKTEYKRNKIKAGEQRRKIKMYGQFCRDVNTKTDKGKRWAWLKKGDLKPETEAIICAAQEQALRTNYIKHKIDHTQEDDRCRMCGQKGETAWHIISECEKLAQEEYKRRHDNVARIIHLELCGKYGIDRTKNWYEQRPIGVMENEIKPRYYGTS